MTPRRLFVGGIAMSIASVLSTKSQLGPGTGSAVQLAPSGDSSGATDTAQINEALKNYPIVRLLPGKFTKSAFPTVSPWYVNAPIIVPSNTRLTGDWFWQAVDS